MLFAYFCLKDDRKQKYLLQREKAPLINNNNMNIKPKNYKIIYQLFKKPTLNQNNKEGFITITA